MGDYRKNFNRSEFLCKCDHDDCPKELPTDELADRVQLMRDKLGYSITLSSGVRCERHNRAIGGVENSTHVRRIAVDIETLNSTDRGAKLNAAIGAGFRAIGIGRGFLHLDLRHFDTLMCFDYYGESHVA